VQNRSPHSAYRVVYSGQVGRNVQKSVSKCNILQGILDYDSEPYQAYRESKVRDYRTVMVLTGIVTMVTHIISRIYICVRIAAGPSRFYQLVHCVESFG